MSAAAMPDSLGHSVLVLNRLYMAVHVINVRRAVGLLVNALVFRRVATLPLLGRKRVVVS